MPLAAMRSRKFVAEALGAMGLLAIVVGSGMMGERLAGGSAALALLANTLATGAGLIVLILVFGPISGAHFNPAVTLVFALKREISIGEALGYGLAQIIGAIAGVMLAHAMFAEPLIQVSAKARDGWALTLSESVATFGLIVTILGCARHRPESVPYAVGLYVAAAYWFTASTAFANPAVTLARALTSSFAGIAPASVPGFIGGQLLGAGGALAVMQWMAPPKEMRA